MRNEIPMALAGGAAVVPIPLVRPVAERPAVAEEQLAYAQWLDLGMKVGFLVTVASFVVYLSGLLAPRVPVADLPRYWSLPVKQYLAATGTHGGWSWLGLLRHGDFLNFVGIAFLSGVTIACYAGITPILFRKRDSVFAWLAVAEVAVLVLAASGVVGAGAH